MAGWIGGIVSVIIVYVFFRRKINCPECNEPLPFPRKPESFSNAMWGGWICKNCGTKVNGRGNKIELDKE